jgi:hypothetical protein
MKLGKAPAAPRTTDFKFSAYRTTDLPVVPDKYGFDHAVAPDAWGMLGNDDYGDCVWAGAAHEHMMLTATQSDLRPSPTTAQFTRADALGDYAACTGFDPNTGNGDNGTDVHQAMSYRRSTGILDAAGKRHKIGAYLSLEPGNMTQVWEALYLFQCVGIGFQFPNTAMDQFNNGQRWSIVAGAQIEGGHYVPVVSKQGTFSVKVITWGKLQTMTQPFYKKYCDESWCYVAPDLLNNAGLSARGFDIDQLNADLAAL